MVVSIPDIQVEYRKQCTLIIAILMVCGLSQYYSIIFSPPPFTYTSYEWYVCYVPLEDEILRMIWQESTIRTRKPR